MLIRANNFTLLGEVECSQNYQERFKNLNSSSHNFLRITRILKCLGEFGFEHYKVCLVHHLCLEAKKNTLPNILDSCLSHYIPCIKCKIKREKLLTLFAKK